ncbi:hypothetical protein CW745_06575 [Psychromonas sp. psych-6C06]|uniref:DUF2057 family protein n=1 Tax=Psychromonas sp. psych-6C06 TaxID=2058089 RepID=UPI000C323E3C|nr:DUF2057 family protein [Psychromonas sp. psych-6C06]PKF63079.1 hypothetical protein CW745_06575 [Psychromonas sp. psych-6C06]
MGWKNKLLVSILTVCTFSVQASVKVSLHQDLEALVINNKNVGFTIFGDNEFTLENGQQQIVVRVSKLIIKQGEKEKFKSEPVIVTFNANDADLVLSPTRTFIRREEIKGFDKNPVLVATKDGEQFQIEQSILERGVGITRDYAAELKAQNELSNGAEIAVAAVATTTTKQDVAKVAVSPVKMSQDLFAKASVAEKEQFTNWAFKNRKMITSELNGEGKILPMLEYWYEKASTDQKAELLTWILAQ